MQGNPAVWFEIYVADIQRAKAFYQTVLDTQLESLTPPDGELEMWAFSSDMSQHGAGGALVRMQGVEPGGNSTIIYFACADCAVEGARVVPAGGRIMKEKFSIGEYGFIVLAFDTEGNLFGLHSLA